VFGVTTQSGTTAPVVVSNNGQLGTVASSERFKQIEALTAGLQKVSAQLEASKATPQVVNNP
jgi:hypothetical protein